jgi:hypothetical protein
MVHLLDATRHTRARDGGTNYTGTYQEDAAVTGELGARRTIL